VHGIDILRPSYGWLRGGCQQHQDKTKSASQTTDEGIKQTFAENGRHWKLWLAGENMHAILLCSG
jgi:hypothetical protein